MSCRSLEFAVHFIKGLSAVVIGLGSSNDTKSLQSYFASFASRTTYQRWFFVALHLSCPPNRHFFFRAAMVTQNSNISLSFSLRFSLFSISVIVTINGFLIHIATVIVAVIVVVLFYYFLISLFSFFFFYGFQVCFH